MLARSGSALFHGSGCIRRAIARRMTILVHHVGSLGDTIVTIPALRALKAEWPDARLVLLHDGAVPSRPEAVPSSTVLATTTLIDQFIPYARHHGAVGLARELVRVWRAIRRLRPSAAVFVGPSERAVSATRRDRLLYRLAGVRRFYGFGPSTRAARDDGGGHEATRKLARLARDGVRNATDPRVLLPPFLAIDGGDTAPVDAWLEAIDAKRDRLVAVGPETLMAAKLWPKERFVELGRRLLAHGWQPILVGSGRGAGSADDWVALWGGGHDAGGRWTVRQSAALLTRCLAFVGVDSGVAHLAAAVARPAVVLTSGRADIGQWDPLGPGHVVLRHRTPCERCRAISCPVAGHPCMTGLSVDDAWDAVTRVLGSSAAAVGRRG